MPYSEMVNKRKLSTRRNGDVIKVKIIDDNFNTYYEAEANVNDKKSMIRLIKELKDKGITFPREETDWFG